MVINRNITNTNFTSAANTAATWGAGKKRSIEWLVIHYTANGQSYKGMAKNNTIYFKTEYRGASAHYFVDDYEAWQCVEDKDSSWHCGDAPSKNGCYNWNSIGIEICDNNGEITAKAEALAVELVKYLMKKYNIKADHVCRHYDVTGKLCPLSFAKNVAKWNAFKSKLAEKPITAKPNTEVKISMVDLTGINTRRGTNALVLITDGRTTTGFNKYGTDVIVGKDGKIKSVVIGKANTAIPAGCICLSGHGKNDTFLRTLKKGAKLKIG